ncbi:MAG: hypothetical protein KDD02_23575, partial [Phaeodactylibacter sp.]|nr:hypothetical protein [Phaeodactylibacter sp.]
AVAFNIEMLGCPFSTGFLPFLVESLALPAFVNFFFYAYESRIIIVHLLLKNFSLILCIAGFASIV